MRRRMYDGDTITGTITDVSPYRAMSDKGIITETRKAAVSAVDDEAFVFMTESAAKFWLWLKSKVADREDSNVSG